MRGALFILISLISGLAAAVPVSARFTTSVARDLDPNPGADRARLAIEPGLRFELTVDNSVSLGAVVERPLDPHIDYAVPKVAFENRQSFSLVESFRTAVRPAVTLLNLERWRADGAIVRPGLRFEFGGPLAFGVGFELLAGPYLHLCEEGQATDGTDHTRFGFSESLALEWRRGIFRAQAKILFDQRHSRIWYDDVAFSQTVALRVTDWIELGATHDRLTSAVDPTTGRYQGFVNTAGTHRLGLFAGLTL